MIHTATTNIPARESDPVWIQAENLTHKLAQLDLLLSSFLRCNVVEEFNEKEVITLLGLASDLAMESLCGAESILKDARSQLPLALNSGP